MARLSFLLLAVVLFFGGSLAVLAVPFDFFAFVQQWPGTTCAEHSCPQSTVEKAADGFLIHGLWPNYDNGSYPQNCNDCAPFSMDPLRPLMDELETYWPSLYSASEDFWQHEYEKHACCATQIFDTEYDFFDFVLTLRQKIDLLSALQAAGIDPTDDGTTYSVSSIAYAIKDQLGVSPLVFCSDSSSSSSAYYQQGGTKQYGTKMVDSIWLAVSTELEVTDFPKGIWIDTGCDSGSEQVVFPSFNQN